MLQPVFIRQAYEVNQYLNPSNSKVKRHFLKKSQPRSTNSHTRNLSLQLPNRGWDEMSGTSLNELKDILNGNTILLKEIRQSLNTQKSASDANTVSPHEIRFLRQKYSGLQSQILTKDQKLQALRERYEMLLLKFQHHCNQTKSNSFNSSFDTHTNPSLSPSRATDYLNQLKKIRERLKEIDFSRIFMMINRTKKTSKKRD